VGLKWNRTRGISLSVPIEIFGATSAGTSVDFLSSTVKVALDGTPCIADSDEDLSTARWLKWAYVLSLTVTKKNISAAQLYLSMKFKQRHIFARERIKRRPQAL
jgi:hypothetical protein